MRCARFLALAAVALVSAAPAAVSRPDGGPPLVVRQERGSFRPGDVALIVVESARPLTAVTGEALGRAIGFWPAGPLRWQGIAGVAADTPAGHAAVTVNGTYPDGAVINGRLTFSVGERAFETRRLRVEPRFVTPPAAERQRIEEERHLLANTFGRATPDRLWRGPFATPVDGAGTSSFGRLTLLNGRPNGRHQGADFRAALGTPVRAPNSGRIVLVADLYFAGRAVVIDHGLGLFSLFAHLERAAVEVGAVVARGDLI